MKIEALLCFLVFFGAFACNKQEQHPPAPATPASATHIPEPGGNAQGEAGAIADATASNGSCVNCSADLYPGVECAADSQSAIILKPGGKTLCTVLARAGVRVRLTALQDHSYGFDHWATGATEIGQPGPACPCNGSSNVLCEFYLNNDTPHCKAVYRCLKPAPSSSPGVPPKCIKE
jgi:hypothetical protein